MLYKLYKIFVDFSKQLNRKNISAFASSTAFFMFLSLIPISMILSSMIPFTPLTEENLILAVQETLPNVVASLLVSVIQDVYAGATGMMLITVLITIWSAAKGMLALIRGLDEIYDIEENRNYFLLRSIAALYTLLMLVALLLSLMLMVFGNVIVDVATYRLPKLNLVIAGMMHFRFLVSWGVLTLLFALIYTYVPNRKTKFRLQLPGAVFSAVVWSIYSWGFSIYIDRFHGFSTYGSLATIIIVMIWIYFCFYIIMIGAHINRYFGPVYQFLFMKRKARE